ncbi:MAG: N-acetylglucosaminyltransferase [Frankiales bacterium]|nr:N-acetylglucosaminyltransferase [Frankiales bacterium]
MLRDWVRGTAGKTYARLLARALEPQPRATARVISIDEATSRSYLRRSVEGLHDARPELSCKETTTPDQRRLGLGVATALLVLLVVETRLTLMAIIAVLTYLYAVVVIYRVRLFRRSMLSDSLLVVTDEDALAAEDLPVITVLIPAYKEPEVIARLLQDIGALDYPSSRLDVKLLIEQDDPETLAAIHAARPPRHFSVVLIPDGGPRTKPKAMNYALCLAEGEYIAVYDAEDRPEPLQLRRAVVAFRRSSPDVVCLQGRLAYYNSGHNLITKWFEAEYLAWFRFFLPGLAERHVPVPLGGTSNVMRRKELQEVGGWDPYNVTEDADLGIRLHRAGYRTGVLHSTTLEEANSDFVNWAKQRSRWQKGYLQTWLVHMRHPVDLWRELGPSGFFNFNFFVGGTPLLALMNPVFWALTIMWFVTESTLIGDLFPPLIYFPALICWVIGNAVVVYLGVVSVDLDGQPELAVAALLAPLYWVMMSVAAYKAAWQLVRNPSLWEKTAHGLTANPAAAPPVQRLAS